MEEIKIRILLVEDEPKVASFIKLGLEEVGYWVESADNGNVGKQLFDRRSYDLVILDVLLPGISGIELCKQIRKSDDKIPVLMLTALGTNVDKLKGFDAGADDYLLKPFEFGELVARIKALLKRTNAGEKALRVLKFMDLEMNLDNYEVKRGETKIELSQKEFGLLEYLLRNKGKVVTRAEIAENVWNISFDSGTNIIDVYVNFLRKKIDKDFEPKLIKTQVGVGYILKE